MESQKQERRVKELKNVTKIIALASIVSFIVSYSSLVSSLQQKLLLLSMYTNLVDKKYMFLLCNGIVCFIMGNFETLLHGKPMSIIEETKEILDIKDMRASEMKKTVARLDEKSACKEEEEGRIVLFREGEEDVTLVVEDDKGLVVQDLAIIRIDDDEVHDSLLSSEDLQKRCEDFIRKVKAEIRFESRKVAE